MGASISVIEGMPDPPYAYISEEENQEAEEVSNLGAQRPNSDSGILRAQNGAAREVRDQTFSGALLSGTLFLYASTGIISYLAYYNCNESYFSSATSCIWSAAGGIAAGLTLSTAVSITHSICCRHFPGFNN